MTGTVDVYHISPDLIRKFDDEIGAAKAKVVADRQRTETVSLAVKVAEDKEGDILVTYDEKMTHVRKTNVIYTPGQIELELSG